MLSELSEKMEEEYDEVMASLMEGASAIAFFHVVQRHPDARFSDVDLLSVIAGVSDIKIGPIFNSAGSAKEWLKLVDERVRTSLSAPGSDRSHGGKCDSINHEEIRTLDESVLGVLSASAEWVSLSYLRSYIDESINCVRSSLSRLVLSGDVEEKGKTKGKKFRAILLAHEE